MNVGDLLGSGTISGPEKHQYGSLLEITWGGTEALMLDTGETRTFIPPPARRRGVVDVPRPIGNRPSAAGAAAPS